MAAAFRGWQWALRVSIQYFNLLLLELSNDYFFNRVNRAINYFSRA